MKMTQAMIILINGIRKYGAIIEGECDGRIKFIPSAKINEMDETKLSGLIEHIPVNNIFSIDTFLK
jgi:hypothetical protein